LQKSGYHEADLHLHKGRAYFELHCYQDARNACKKALANKDQPEFFAPAYELAEKACTQMHDHEAAKANHKLAQKERHQTTSSTLSFWQALHFSSDKERN
jgi:tetratricopeptide (TPR) repeat protein